MLRGILRQLGKRGCAAAVVFSVAFLGCSSRQGVYGRVGYSKKGFNCVAFSPDGRYVATGGGENVIRIWDVETGFNKAVTYNSGLVTSLTFSPDSKSLVGAVFFENGGAEIRLWDLPNQREETLLTPRSLATMVAFSPDGEKLAVLMDRSSSAEPGITVLNLKEKTAFTLEMDVPGSYMAWSPTGKEILAVVGMKVLQYWSLATQKGVELVRYPVGREAPCITSFAYGSDDTEIYLGLNDGSLVLHNKAAGGPKIYARFPKEIVALAYSKRREVLAISCEFSTFFLYKNPACLGELHDPMIGGASSNQCLALSADGLTLAQASNYLWFIKVPKCTKLRRVSLKGS